MLSVRNSLNHHCCGVLCSFSTGNWSALRSAMMLSQRAWLITCSRERIHMQVQDGVLTTEYSQNLPSLTIQQFPSISRVDENSTFSFALDFVVSVGSGKAFPTLSTFRPLRVQELSTRIVPSVLREQVAVVMVQSRSKQNGITACSYHFPRYLGSSTYGTVFGGSLCKLMNLNETVATTRRAKRAYLVIII